MTAGIGLRPAGPAQRDLFEGMQFGGATGTPAADQPNLGTAVQRFARASADIVRMRRDGYEELPHQTAACQKALRMLDAVRPEAARDLRAALLRDMGLIDEAAQGRTGNAIRAMALEAEMRVNPELRADRFIEDFDKLVRQHRRLRESGEESAKRAIEKQMSGMAWSMERDAQAESLVRKKLPKIGIEPLGAARVATAGAQAHTREPRAGNYRSGGQQPRRGSEDARRRCPRHECRGRSH